MHFNTPRTALFFIFQDIAMNPLPSPSPSPSPPHTPLHARRPQIEQVFYQARPNAQEYLIYAIKNFHDIEFDQALDQLLEDGASLEQLDNDGLTPLEIAVIEGRPRIVQALLDRNALLPIVDEDGFDLLMLSASCGNTATMLVLIDQGEMQCNVQDARGLTSLHYAVIGGHLPAAVTLLDRGADINRCTTAAVDRETCEHMGISPALAQSGSTPLMLAVSKGHLALVDLLLSRGANSLAGDRHPFELAIYKNDAAMMGLLIQKGIDPTTIILINGQSMLSLAVECQCSLACIKQLLPPDKVVNDQTSDAHSPLRIAVRTGQHEIAAYLLCRGAKISAVDQLYQTAWECAHQLPDQGKMTQILVATRCKNAVNAFSLSNGTAVELLQTANDLPALATLGFFPEVLIRVVAELKPMENAMHRLTRAQQEVEIAYMMMVLCTPNARTNAEANAEANAETNTEVNAEINALASASMASIIPVPSERQFISSIPKKIATQRNELHSWAKRIVDQYKIEMLDLLSRSFLMSTLTTCPEGADLSVYMSRKLREAKGIPDDLSNIIVSSWVSAHNNVSQWGLTGADANSINLCKEYYAMQQIEYRLFKKIQALQSQGKKPSLSIQFLYAASGQCILPAKELAKNPVIFLQRLPPVDQSVVHQTQPTTTLCLQTGWSPLECQKIIDLWTEANNTADSTIPTNEIERRYHFLCREMAIVFKAILPQQHHHPDGTPHPLPSRWQTQLHRWSDATLARHNGAASSITVNSDDEEGRPQKRARTH